MAIASGIFKQLRYKKESSWGTPPATDTAQLLRRVTSDLNLQKAVYESQEIRSDFQVADMRHGIRSVGGTINGELSPKTYADFMGAAVRKLFATGVNSGALTTITATVTTAPAGKFVRGSGDWMASGFKVGDVVRCTGWTAGATANNAHNFLITALTALEMTVTPLDGVAFVAKAAGDSVTITVTGKKTWVPVSGHTDESFSIEHWFPDITQRELFVGAKPSQIDIAMPATGIATIGIQFLGKGIQTGTTEFFASGTLQAETTTGILTAVSGQIMVNGVGIATVTGGNLSIAGNFTPAEVAGSNDIAAVFPGRVRVSGEVSAYFENATLRDAFLNETDVALQLILTAGSAAAADFVSFVMPRIKTGGNSKDDGEKGIIQTIPFTALLNTAGGTGINTEKTTLSIQDSAA